MDIPASWRTLAIDLQAQPPFRVGDASIQPLSREAEFPGGHERLQTQSLKVLVALARRKGEVVTRAELVQSCWQSRVIGEDVINRSILILRQFAERTGGFAIETVPKVGYRLIETRGEAPARKKRLIIIIALAVTLAAALAAIVLLRPRSPPPADGVKVAILGFTSGDRGAEAHQAANAINGALSETLAVVGIHVVPAPAADVGAQPDSVRRESVTFLVSGRVQSDGGFIRVSERIDDAATGSTLFTDNVVLPATEWRSAADRVAGSIANTVDSWSWILRNERDSDRVRSLIRIQTAWYQDVIRAYRLSRELAESAPKSGAAQYMFAQTTANALPQLPRDEREEALPAARAAARRAEALLPKYGDVYALNCFLTPPGRWVASADCAERMRRGLAMDPNSYFLPFFYADSLVEVGRYDAARLESARALAAAPLDPGRLALRLQVLWMLRKTVAGGTFDVAGLEQTINRYSLMETDGRVDGIRYQTLLWAGDMKQAEEMLRDPHRGANLEPDAHGPAHLIFQALHSRSAKDIATARAACDPAPPRWMPPDPAFGTCITGLVLLNDLDAVFDMATKGYQDVSCCSAADAEKKLLAGGGIQYPRDYLLGPAAAKLRSETRYIDVARRTGLLAYWKSGHPPDFCSFERVPVCAIIKLVP
jgi:DNA-binding winged helix-turn-helix (wHTH) protein/TolB-like protein